MAKGIDQIAYKSSSLSNIDVSPPIPPKSGSGPSIISIV
jgi:hypothetical protein